MKVGILTYQNQLNYGAILQAFALQRTIASLGVEVEDVNYWFVPDNAELQILPWGDIRHPWRKISLKRIFLALCFPIKTLLTFRRRVRTVRFLHRNIRQSEKIYRGADDFVGLDEYDCLVVGSDQVWHYASRSRDVFLALMVPGDVRRVAYSASLGCEEIPGNNFSVYKHALAKFSAISLREPSSVPVIKNILGDVGPEVKSAVDPVFLLDRNEWLRVAGPREKKKEKKFILLYWIGNCAEVERVIKAIRASSSDRILLLYDWRLSAINSLFLRTVVLSSFLRRNKVSCRFDVGPSEFLSLVEAASYIVSNSFHALAFAYIFKTPIKVVVGNGASRIKMGSRMRDLLALIDDNSRNLYDCIPDDFGSFTPEVPVAAYESEAFRCALFNSHKFLKNALRL